VGTPSRTKGMTDFELAQLFEVTKATINNWKNVHPEFADALHTGKAFADERVERALYSRAVGYSYAAEEIFVRPRAGKRGGSEVIRAKVIKRVPPDVTAQIFWLKNRRRDQWRDVHKHEVNPGNPINNMSQDELRASIQEDLKLLGMLPDGAPPTNRRDSRTLTRTPDCGGQTQ
jgi:hypothetical protein